MQLLKQVQSKNVSLGLVIKMMEGIFAAEQTNILFRPLYQCMINFG
ncbi:hypothetical protein [Desmospora activa]|uniref:Uncharacterized protein n=1 Tax=Desmospora activa DSM 45169 TaxID=1121389 RepID=A0A2T4Z4L1_9BACL|nr:hypothetical protein [Desmospora activa]PTM56805.1 hypothetical protein C8J48_3130 [Desmospora activa DSM 45169]